MASIFVLVIDNGYDGHSPPIQAYPDEATARNALAFMASTGSNNGEIYEVPMWPEVNGKSYWEIQALSSDAPAS